MAGSIDLRALLAEGRHALSLGRVPEAVLLIEAKPRLASRLLELLWDDDPGVAQRAADVLERVSHDPSSALARILAAAKDELIGLAADAELKKLRWNLALTLGRLTLTAANCRRLAAVYYTYFDDRSSIVRTAALQGLADLTRHDSSLLPEVLDTLRIHGRSGTPAMQARARILLKKLEPAVRNGPKSL